MKKSATGRPLPDLTRARRALTPLVRLIDGFFDRGEALKKRGWYSFEPYWTFLESLCSPEEWHVHKTYLIESRKEHLGNYHSDYVAALKASHKGEDPRALTACNRRVLDLRNNANHYQVAWGPFEEEQMRLRQREIELHATSVSRRCSDDERKERVRIWSQATRERAGPLGFEARAPSKYHPSRFRRKLGGGWDFMLGVDARRLGSETADTIAKPPGMGPLPIGSHLTWMALVPSGRPGPHRGDSSSIFVPQYFVPFDRAYANFWDFEGLEINVLAFVTGIEILWPEMEPRLIEAVTGLQ